MSKLRKEEKLTQYTQNFGRILSILLILFVLVACQSAGQQSGTSTPMDSPAGQVIQTPQAENTYPNARLLLDVEWLVENLDDPGIRIIDVREPQDYAQAHIPGAVNIPVGDIVSTVEGIPFVYEERVVQEALNRSGLTPEMTAVIYGDLGMMNSARLFWTLEYIGHEDVRILNGGWNAWVEAGERTEDTPSQVAATQYPLQRDPAKIVTADEIHTRLDDPDVVIVDARSPQEYFGEVKLADRGGRIPGAVNLVWLDALTGGDTLYTTERGWQAELQDEDVEVFKSKEELQTMLDESGITPDKEIVTYCQTLWRGAHIYFLFRLMGFEDVRGYDGSWVEWGNRSDLPVETGPLN